MLNQVKLQKEIRHKRRKELLNAQDTKVRLISISLGPTLTNSAQVSELEPPPIEISFFSLKLFLKVVEVVESMSPPN